eukprot:IDg21490t1
MNCVMKLWSPAPHHLVSHHRANDAIENDRGDHKLLRTLAVKVWDAEKYALIASLIPSTTDCLSSRRSEPCFRDSTKPKFKNATPVLRREGISTLFKDNEDEQDVVGAQLGGATMLEVANAVAGERATRSRKAKDKPVETPEYSGGPRDLP